MTTFVLACGFGRVLKPISAASLQRTLDRSRSSFLHNVSKDHQSAAVSSPLQIGHGYRPSTCHNSAMCMLTGTPTPKHYQTGKGVPQAQPMQNCSLNQSRGFHITPKRNIPPVLWLILKPVAKLGAIISGRTVRKWWQSLSDKHRQRFWASARRRWYLFALAGAGLCGLGMVYYHFHVEETPLTGRERFIAVTRDQFMKIASAEAESQQEKYKAHLLPSTHPYYERVLRVAKRLVSANPEASKLLGSGTWKCHIIDDPTVNAFVLATGDVFVFTGILDFAQNDDQLAIILAHEMAHALLNHGIEQISYVQLVDLFIISTMAALWCIMPNDGISLVTQWFYVKIIDIMLHMPYSRLLEKEADKVGLQLAARACYDVREGSVFWARMGLNDDVTGSDDSIPEWLSTHPSYEKRVELFDFLIPKAVELREDAKCAPLPTTDPRATIKMLSAMVEEHLTAKRTGQNLTRVKILTPLVGAPKSA